MRISKKILACVLAALMAISMMPFTVLADEEVPEGATYSITNAAGVTTYKYDEFPSSLSDQGTYKLYTDVNAIHRMVPSTALSNITLDLNGHNFISTAEDYIFLFGGKVLGTKTFNIINTSSYTSYITGDANIGIGFDKSNVNFTLGENVVLNTNKTGIVLGDGKSKSCKGTTVTIDGTVNAASEYGLTVNGAIQDADPAPAVIVNGAVNGSTAGIYAAGNADYTINGTVTGATGIYQKGGNLTVNDGAVVTGTGADAAYVQMSDGMSSTGDAIVVEDNGSYKLGTTVINGGTITSTAAGTNAIAEYDATTAASTAAEQDITVSGGTFVAAGAKDDISEYLIEGATQDENGVVAQTYVAKVNGVLYADFEEAVAAARTGSVKTVECLSDIDLTSYAASAMHYIDITGVTVDLNDHQMDIGTHWCVLFCGTNGKIMNGTCVGHDSSAYANYAYGIYIWSNGKGNVKNTTVRSNIELENLTCNYGIHCWNADVTIKDCDVTGSNSYYAVWADENSNVTIESGNFTTGGAAVLGAARSGDGNGNISVEGGDFTVPAGKKLVLPSSNSSKPDNVKFSGGTTNVVISAENCADGFVPVTTPDANGKYTVGVPQDGTNITVAETISENFYLDDDFYGEEAYVAVTYNTNANASETPDVDTEIKALSSYPTYSSTDEYNGNRIISITQAPAQVTENVEIKVYATQADAQAGTNAVKTISYSTYDYCTNIIENSSNTKLVELAEATLDYAAAAQTYFNYNTDNMATADNAGNDFYNDVAGTVFEDVFTPNFGGLFTNATVVVKSDLEINLLTKKSFSYEYNYYNPSKGGGRFGVSTYVNGSYNVLHIKGIEPANMDEIITLYTSYGYVDITANSIMKIMAKSSDTNMATLAKAMYRYGQAANAYFD